MELDAAYDNGGHIPDAAAYPDRWADAAMEWRSLEAALGRARLNLPYGADDRQRYDLFYPAGRPAGLAGFVHGGYWRRFGRQDWSHLAAGCTARGWACAVPSYRLAPAARIAEITTDIAAAVTAAAGQVAGPIALAGHSAGGHLVARMAMEGGPLAADVVARVARVVPISPLADLRPLLRTSMNADLRLDGAEAVAESPIFGVPCVGTAVTVWVGAEERPAFVDQARWLGDAWGVPVRQAAGRHHFDVVDALCDPDSRMIADLLGG